MINVIDLPWYQVGTHYYSDTLYGRVELKPGLQPWTIMTWAFDKPLTGWAIVFRGQKIGWTRELKDAYHYATNHITAKANQGVSK